MPSGGVLSDAEQRETTVMPWVVFAGMTREDLVDTHSRRRGAGPV